MTTGTDRQTAVATMLLDAIRQQSAAGGAAAPVDPQDLRALLFCNTRSLRLRAEGFRLLARFFEPFPVDLPPEREIRSSYVIYLDQQASLPWYIGQSRGVRQITLFDSRMATELRLRGDDFDKLLKSRRLYGHGRKPKAP